MQNNCSKRALLKEIQETDFVITELNLYLDTHPCCTEALEMLEKYVRKSRQIKYEYEKMFGPLTAASNMSTETWQWICGPWPWENC